MISILQHIQYLILTGDCVIVPGLGAFVARIQPARISDDGLWFEAPSRELTFNSLLVHDDGLLTGSITRREGVSYECARSAVEQEVELIHRRLRHEGAVSLGRIGILSLTPHGAIEFTPDAVSPVFALPYQGFRRLPLAPLVSNRSETAEPIIMETKLSSRRSPVIMSALKYAASAAVLIGVCLTMLTPISPERIEMASFSAAPAPALTEDIQQTVHIEPARFAGRTIVISEPNPQEGKAIAGIRRHVSETTDNYAAQTSTAIPRHYLIVASTSSLAEARRYVRAHSSKKHPLAILPSDGRYRIYAAAGNDFNRISALRSADPAFAAANPNAWVYSLP